MAIENWIFDEESVFLTLGKTILIIVLVFAPFIYWLMREDQTAQAECMNRGGGWAVVGSHEVPAIWAGKVYIAPHTVTDYGCVEVVRSR